jgi:Acyl-CoA oxidase
MVEGLNTFAGHSFITAEDAAYLRLAQEQAIETFGLHVDTILDAYSFTDYETDSNLCKSDRTPYEAIMDVVRKSPLNDTQFMRPTMISARLLWKKYPSPSL